LTVPVLSPVDPLPRDPPVFDRAALCNRLAKGAFWLTRILLYQIKNECIDVLQTRLRGIGRPGFDRHRGLLSIALKEYARVALS
jgi:hypothetical protein